jgi:hypothetical protein
MDTIDLAPGSVTRVITEQAAALKNPSIEVADLLGTLRDLGLVQSVARLRELFG